MKHSGNKSFKAFTLIELLVVVAIIGILTAVGVVAYGKYTDGAKNAIIKSNHQKIKELIKAEIADCHLSGGRDYKVIRYERSGGKTFREREFRCRSAFSNELQVHFLALGLRDPVIQEFSFYKRWTYNGTVLPNDAGAAWWGTPRKGAKYHPAYWVGKTWIEEKWIDGSKNLKLTSYLMDETTNITDTIQIPFK